jgi:hypothetical protein
VSRGSIQMFWRKFSAFNFIFFFILGGYRYVIHFGTVVTEMLDMRPRKHNLHFLVGVELLPHAFVNIPDEKMHIGVFIFILIISYIFIFFNIFEVLFIYIYS